MHAPRQSLQAIWREDATDGDGMLPLRVHAELLGEVIEAVHEQGSGLVSDWLGAGELLRMASFVEDVSAGPATPRNHLCGATGGAERAYGEMARLWLAGTMIFGLVWQAYELSVSARRPGSVAQGADGVKLATGSHERGQVPHLAGLTGAAVERIKDLLPDDRRAKLRKRIEDFDADGDEARLAAASLAIFRNALIHAALTAPATSFGDEDDDPIEDDGGIRVFHDAIRLTLVMIQSLVVDGLPREAELDWDDDVVAANELILNLHMRRTVPAFHDRQPKLPGLMG